MLSSILATYLLTYLHLGLLLIGRREKRSFSHKEVWRHKWMLAPFCYPRLAVEAHHAACSLEMDSCRKNSRRVLPIGFE
jgi:hypothetical protein